MVTGSWKIHQVVRWCGKLEIDIIQCQATNSQRGISVTKCKYQAGGFRQRSQGRDIEESFSTAKPRPGPRRNFRERRHGWSGNRSRAP